MVIYSQPKSRQAESPYSRINAEAVALAGQAEVELLRRLLRRCDSFLAVVAQEARIDGEPDYYADELLRDISVALGG